VQPEYRAIGGRNDSEQFVAQSEFLQARARPLSLERVLDHLCHAAEVAGVEHVGLGSDFDGIQRTPQGLEDASCYLVLAEGLHRRGFSPAETRLVLGGNFERVYAAVTAPGTVAADASWMTIE
jgi:membrane dipeptidase